LPNGNYLHWVGGVNIYGDCLGVTVLNSCAYIADKNYGLWVIDITNPQNPEIVSSVKTPGSARNAALKGTYAYVADWDSGLQVIDIADPLNPQISGSVAMPGHACGLAISGTYVYVADDTIPINYSNEETFDVIEDTGSPIIEESLCGALSLRAPREADGQGGA
jgi:hypothetical protein